MKMSDKDLDQLFSSKLADMEMEPSANVWSNITNELDGVKAEKKGGIPFMRIAASIVVIMGVSLFFIRPKTTVTELHPSAASQVADVVSGGSSRTSPVTLQPTVDPVVEEQPVTTETTVRRRINQTASRVAGITTTPMSTEVDTTANTTRLAVTTQQTNNTSAPIIAQVQTPIVQNIVVKNNVDASTSTKANPVNKPNDRVIASLTNKTPETTKKKRGIHSLGDLLNVVIAKVDKREDKLIEFTNSNDDDSFNVTGLNLGLLHAKKDN